MQMPVSLLPEDEDGPGPDWLGEESEEDTDGDGRFDKWETFDGARLAVVAFDTAHRGIPDRRLVYDLNGNVKVEVDARGDGHFVPVDQAASSPETRPAR